MRQLVGSLVAATTVVGIFLAVRYAARKYEARRIAEGAWGPDGPLRPTEAPLGWRYHRGQWFSDSVWRNRKLWFGHRDAAPFKTVSANKGKKRKAK
jgi:hypothetical protein